MIRIGDSEGTRTGAGALGAFGFIARGGSGGGRGGPGRGGAEGVAIATGSGAAASIAGLESAQATGAGG